MTYLRKYKSKVLKICLAIACVLSVVLIPSIPADACAKTAYPNSNYLRGNEHTGTGSVCKAKGQRVYANICAYNSGNPTETVFC